MVAQCQRRAKSYRSALTAVCACAARFRSSDSACAPERALPQRFVVLRQKGDGAAERGWIPRHQRLATR
eukprot:1737581-Prymnesium_polylepis.3